MSRTNRFFQRTATASLLAAFATIAAQPAYAGTTPGVGEITIVRPLSFVIDDNLDFGTIIRGTTAGTVAITPTGTRTQTGGVTLVNGGGHKAASFAGQGTFLQRVEISMGANSISLNGPGAPNAGPRFRHRQYADGCSDNYAAEFSDCSVERCFFISDRCHA